MSGVGFYITTPEIALAAATAKTVIHLTAGTNHRVLIYRMGFYFDGQTVGNEPVFIEWSLTPSGGSGSTAGTPQKVDPDDSETLQVDFVYNYTSEPSYGNIDARWYVHPQVYYELPLPVHKPIIIRGGNDGYLRFTAPDAVNVTVNIEGEE